MYHQDTPKRTRRVGFENSPFDTTGGVQTHEVASLQHTQHQQQKIHTPKNRNRISFRTTVLLASQ
jgi:hypothetical protein